MIPKARLRHVVIVAIICALSSAHGLAQTLREPLLAISPTALCLGRTGPVTFVGSDQLIAVGDSLGNVSIWSVEPGSKPRRLLESCTSDPMRALEASRDGKRLSVAWANRTLVLDLSTGRPIRTVSKYEYHGGGADLIDFAMDPGCSVLAFAHKRTTSSDGGIQGVLGIVLGRGEMPVPGGSVSEKRVVSLWDAVNDRLIGVLDSGEEIQFSKDGRILAVRDNRTKISLWDATTGKRISAIEDNKLAPRGFAVSADGGLLAFASGGQLTVWDIEMNKRLRTFPVGSTVLLANAFDPSNHHIVTVSLDGTLMVWDIVTGHAQWKLVGKQGRVTELDVSNDGQYVSAVGVDNLVHIWQLPPRVEDSKPPASGREVEQASKGLSATGNAAIRTSCVCPPRRSLQSRRSRLSIVSSPALSKS